MPKRSVEQAKHEFSDEEEVKQPPKKKAKKSGGIDLGVPGMHAFSV